jgi:hypothetical protein
MIRAALVCALAAAAPALDLDAEPWLRSGIPLRVTATVASAATEVTAWIDIPGRSEPAAIIRLSQVPAGRIDLALVPRTTATTAWLRVAADGATRALPLHAPRRGERPPGPAGRFEDLRQERLAGLPAARAVIDAQAATCGWSIRADRWGLVAERRWPVRDPRRTALFIHPQSADHLWWPTPPGPALAAAAVAGTEVVELHPFGSDGDGVLAARIRERSATVDLVVEWGPGLAAAAARGPARTVATAEALRDPAMWMGGATAPVLRTALPAWAEPGVVLVVGTGEHDAARRANRALADAFAAAWRRHAGDDPERTDDAAAADPGDPRTRILIGSPLSNRAAAPFAAVMDWDHRTVAIPGTGIRWHRSENRPVHARLPDPRRPGRWLVLLTGAPAWDQGPGWRPGRLPLAGLPDLWIGPAAPGERPLHTAGGVE